MIQQASKADQTPPRENASLADVRLPRVQNAIQRSHSYFIREQKLEGYWLAPLDADSTLESDYVLLLRLLEINEEEKIQKAARYVRSKQLPGGGWNIYEGGPEELNATVKSYTALKLSGAPVEDQALRRGRAAIERLGGITRTNTYTRTYLNLIGQFPPAGLPAIPPELILFPHWFYFSIYEISAWSRTILVPLSIVYALQSRVRVPDAWGVSELYHETTAPIDARFPWSKDLLSWRNFFLLTDRILKIWERTPVKPFRKMALKKAEAWMLARLEDSAGLGAIYPAMVNSLLAMKALGYSKDHFQMKRALDEFNKLILDKGDRLQFQPCESPVWDTVLTMLALIESGMSADHPSLLRGASWLLSKQTTKPGDWSVKNPDTPPGGWYFEFYNEFYPDLDDTCVALMVLNRVQYPDQERSQQAQSRGLRWLLDMQSRDGGWASFDRDNDRTLFTQIPFADHNAMLDPSSADITGRILEMLSYFGYTRRSACVDRAVRYLRKTQEADGSWFGRWGVNYTYGTWQVLKGLSAIGEDMHQDYVQAAVKWLRSRQNPDGGWGESCSSYDDPAARIQAPSTPSQTAWAVMGLLSAGDTTSASVLRGLEYLLLHQNSRGDWPEEQFTGTGFPRVFYLRYQYYRNYFPLFALGMYRQLAERDKAKAEKTTAQGPHIGLARQQQSGY